jgi:hypothetical protein
MKGKIMRAHNGLKVKIKNKVKSRKWWEHLIRLMFWFVALFMFMFFNASSIMEGIREYKQVNGDTGKLSTRVFIAIKDNLAENGKATGQIWKYVNNDLSTAEINIPLNPLGKEE